MKNENRGSGQKTENWTSVKFGEKKQKDGEISEENF